MELPKNAGNLLITSGIVGLGKESGIEITSRVDCDSILKNAMACHQNY